MAKECILYERICIECGECLKCDLIETKICDNCGKCLEDIEDYRTLNVDEFIQIQEEKDKYSKKGKK